MASAERDYNGGLKVIYWYIYTNIYIYGGLGDRAPGGSLGAFP